MIYIAHLYSLDLEDTDELAELLSKVEKAVLDRSLEVKKHILSNTRPIVSSDSKGCKTP